MSFCHGLVPLFLFSICGQLLFFCCLFCICSHFSFFLAVFWSHFTEICLHLYIVVHHLFIVTFFFLKFFCLFVLIWVVLMAGFPNSFWLYVSVVSKHIFQWYVPGEAEGDLWPFRVLCMSLLYGHSVIYKWMSSSLSPQPSLILFLHVNKSNRWLRTRSKILLEVRRHTQILMVIRLM